MTPAFAASSLLCVLGPEGSTSSPAGLAALGAAPRAA